MWRRLAAAARRSSRYAREIVVLLLVKTLLLSLLLNGLSAGPAPRRVDASRAEVHLLGPQPTATPVTKDPHGR